MSVLSWTQRLTMHELSVMSYLLDTVDAEARKAGATKVLSVNLVVGERASFVDDSLLFYFDMLTPGRLSEGAQLCIRRTPMRFHCAVCNDDYAPAADHFRCPRCNTPGQVTSDGTEFLIESMEIET
jgi:hydrogenase nickel incorporation protein HypA/HybF